MKIKLLRHIAGTGDVGDEVEVDDRTGRKHCAAGRAKPVAEKQAEKRETRASKKKSTKIS